MTIPNTPPTPPSTTFATLGGGCFWCLEAAYQQIAGVENVVNGYAGGARPNPTYEQVCSGATGHAEVVQVEFDPSVLSYPDLLEIFWVIHNPTTLNRQGYDNGTEYRSIILYHDDSQKAAAEISKQAVQQLWPDPVVTQIMPLEAFYAAEAYHQNYFRSHPEQAYCQIIINPKLKVLRERFSQRLK